MVRTWVMTMCLLAAGCRTARVPIAANTPKPAVGTYVDLEPGWRLRVITPLVAGGGYALKTAPAQEQGNTITLKTGADFLGSETATSVRANQVGGVRQQTCEMRYVTLGIGRDESDRAQRSPVE